MDSSVGPFFFEKDKKDFCAFLEPILIPLNKQEQMLVPALSGYQVGRSWFPQWALGYLAATEDTGVVGEILCGQQASLPRPPP